MKQNKINKLFLILVSIQTIILGILFLIQILRIYYGNDKIFTLDICKKYILQILPVIILWIVLIIFSFIYLQINKYNFKNISKITNTMKLKTFESICPLHQEGTLDNEYMLLDKENKKRKIAGIINIIVLLLCSIMGFGYLVQTKHFSSDGDLTNQAIQMTIHLIPWVIISLISSIIYTVYNEYSAKTSIELIKTIISSEGRKEIITKKDIRKQKIINIARLAIIVLSITLIIHGTYNGGASDVYQKAINICTECIGLG